MGVGNTTDTTIPNLITRQQYKHAVGCLFIWCVSECVCVCVCRVVCVCVTVCVCVCVHRKRPGRRATGGRTLRPCQVWRAARRCSTQLRDLHSEQVNVQDNNNNNNNTQTDMYIHLFWQYLMHI